MFQENELGFEHKNNEILVFFGKKETTLDHLKQKYPFLSFRQVKQTHSDICVKSMTNPGIVEADAHYTSEKNVALIVKTADCLPILIHSNESVLAVHAGWRGVENRITYKALQVINATLIKQVFIGPHILQKSFEVDESVKDLLVQAAAANTENLYYQKNEKYYIDLQKIIESQISSSFNIHKTNQDTYQNPQFNSFRTDKTSQRNLSFIAKIAP